jgi:hypothetical protein
MRNTPNSADDFDDLDWGIVPESNTGRREMSTIPEISVAEIQRQLDLQGYDQKMNFNIRDFSQLTPFLKYRDYCIVNNIPFKVVEVGNHYVLWAKTK